MSRICRKAFLCALLVTLSLALTGISFSVAQEKKDDKTQPADTTSARKRKTKSDSHAANGKETKSKLTAAVPEQEREKDKDKNKEQKAKEPDAAEAKSSAHGGKATGTATSSKAASAPAQTPPAKGMVWVNLDSGIYHKEGSRWYGQTKNGKFMTAADAKKAGYKASKRN